MDKSGSLKSVIGSLGSHVTLGYTVQLLIYQGRELLEGVLVPSAPSPEQTGDFVRRGRLHMPPSGARLGPESRKRSIARLYVPSRNGRSLGWTPRCLPVFESNSRSYR